MDSQVVAFQIESPCSSKFDISYAFVLRQYDPILWIACAAELDGVGVGGGGGCVPKCPRKEALGTMSCMSRSSTQTAQRTGSRNPKYASRAPGT
jgi:hypothetical protein